ncbi:uncharacterized protein LOC132735367, partial [Ruditapes philippinarum]|uniref:uncharacterized protein LOC132735367 n=1 Tax=Ruditapes philippinarum TaxID=129788 RepID=UPI00295B2153
MGFSFSVNVSDVNTNESTVSCQKFEVLDIIKPPPVKNLAVINGSEAGCMSVDWNLQQIRTKYICKLTTTSKCKRDMTRNVLYYRERPTDFAQKICNLPPYDRIVLSVTCRIMPHDTVKGFWSNLSTVSFSVQKDVPYNSPNTTDGLYEIGGSTEKGSHSFIFYFRPLSDCDLHDSPDNVVYCIRVIGNRTCIQHPKFYIETDIQLMKKTEITFLAKNSVGISKQVKRFSVYTEDIAPVPSDLKIDFTRRQKDIMVVATVTTKEKAFKHIYHTVVLCELVVESSCREPLKWFILKTSEKNLTTFVGTATVRFGLITHAYNETQNDVISTEIRWENSEQISREQGSDGRVTIYLILPGIAFLVIYVIS